MTLVAFLRGVNVGGHRTFRPTTFAKDLEQYRLINIGAAGTFVVCKPVSQTRLRLEFRRRLPFQAEVMICTARELIDATANTPFGMEPSRSDLVHFVSVLQKRPRILPPMPLRIPAEGRWILNITCLRNRFVFGVYRREMKAISCLNSIDKLFGVPATTRNWNTITAIVNTLQQL
jgi:uncharacterized protein (DUF1697 family)